MALSGAFRARNAQGRAAALEGKAAAQLRGRASARSSKSAGKKALPPVLQSTLLCRCDSGSCPGASERSPSPTRWLEEQVPRLSQPEPSTPSTSGRQHLPSWLLNISQSPPSDSPASSTVGYEEGWDGSDDGYTPFPSNLPASHSSEGLPSTDLFKSSLRYFGVHEDGDRWRCLSQVWVLLFGVGTRETEGIYSLRAASRDTGMPQDTIIAFEDADDAQRYAGLLEATMEHVPSVSPINVQELLDFCEDAGYKCRLEASGTLLYPPDYNIGMTDWERSLRLREGRFEVLDAEPEPLPPSFNPEDFPLPVGEHKDPPQLHNNAGVGPPPPADIEDARARLERQWM